MQELLAVQHCQHRQQLAQQQQHLASPEHHLALAPTRQQLGVGAALLPLTGQPEGALLLEQATAAGHLGMQHPLQPRPQGLEASLEFGLIGVQLAQHHRGLARQEITGPPEPALAAMGQLRLKPVALADHAIPHAARTGCCKPLLASQSPS